MEGEDPLSMTLDQVLYNALRRDLKEKRHTDMVISFYDETTAKVVHSVGCHRIALTAKSSLLHEVFLTHQVREGHNST